MKISVFEKKLMESMINIVIQKNGFEDEKTIGFCRLVEEYENSGAIYKRNEIFEIFKEIA
jgi:hypothetical protein